jgi:hypothetical protein
MNNFTYFNNYYLKTLIFQCFFNDNLLRLSEIVYPAFEKIPSHGTELDGTHNRNNIISNKFG